MRKVRTLLCAGVLRGQSKSAGMGKDGRLYWRATGGFLSYFSRGVDVLFLLVQEDTTMGPELGWVCYVLDLLDGEVRAFLANKENIRDTPEKIAEHKIFKKRRFTTKIRVARYIDELMKKPPPADILVESRFDIPQKLREKAAAMHKKIYDIREESKKRGWHPSNWRLCFRAERQCKYLERIANEQYQQDLSKSKMMKVQITDAEEFNMKVLIVLQCLFAWVHTDNDCQRPNVGPKGEPMGTAMALAVLKQCIQYEKARGLRLLFGYHHVSSVDATLLGIYGWSKHELHHYFSSDKKRQAELDAIYERIRNREVDRINEAEDRNRHVVGPSSYIQRFEPLQGSGRSDLKAAGRFVPAQTYRIDSEGVKTRLQKKGGVRYTAHPYK